MTVISYTLQAIPFVLALVLGLLIPILLIYLHRNFNAGLSLIGISFLVDAWSLGSAGFNLGINFFFPDLIFLLIGFVAVIRFFWSKEFPMRHKAWFAFVVLVLFSTITGLAVYGSTGGVQARSYFYFVVSGSYAMSFPATVVHLRAIYKTLVVVSVALVGIAIYRWIVYYLPIPALLPPSGTYNIDGAIRVIYSNHALVLAQVMVASFFFSMASPSMALMRTISPLLLGMVVVLQHRSVWLAALVGVLVRTFLGRTMGRSVLSQLLVVAAIASVTAIPLMFSQSLSGVTDQVGASAARALSGGGTGGERLQSWGEIVKNWYKAGPRSIAIGQGFGSDNTRTVVDERGQYRKISYIAHNLYVQTLFNTGIFGLLAYVSAAFYVLMGLYKICKTERATVDAEVLFILVAMQAVYYLPYGVDYLQAMLFGAALAFVAQHRLPNTNGISSTAMR